MATQQTQATMSLESPAVTMPLIDRCLSVCQPWAAMIVNGRKSIENRTWSTPYRGRIAIQASSSARHFDAGSERFLLDLNHPGIWADLEREDLFAFGAIIGTVEIIDVVPMAAAKLLPATDPKLPPAVWAEGPLCWVLRDAVLFREPIESKGKLNLYKLSPELARAVTQAEAVARASR